LAGNATITLQSLKTLVHYTYRVRQATDRQTQEPVKDLYFVNLLTDGNADEGEFTYLGILSDGAFSLTAKSKLQASSGPVAAFRYYWGLPELSEHLAVRHEGKCGRCGRTLTVPESIDAGIGPDCASKMAELI
jgi:hypothetical protein